LKGWQAPDKLPARLDWADVDELDRLALISFRSEFAELLPLIARWDKILRNYGGDTSSTNWESFRPLRLGREEDWSDWLAHLLEGSRSGIFAEALLPAAGLSSSEFRCPRVIREVATEDYRADLLVHWAPSRITHIEVKLGDTNFEKTYPTARQLRRRLSSRNTVWTDIILMPSDSLEDWFDCKKETGSIGEITWDKVAIALRRALIRSRESFQWNSLAYIFCGAIEQKILGIPRRHALSGAGALNFKTGISSQISILNRSLDYGKER
jgi:hypothetical protein